MNEACSIPTAADPQASLFCNDCLRQRLLGIASLLPNSLLDPRFEDAIGILMYHRIAEPPRGLARPTWNITPRRFAEQMEGLLRRGFDPWPLRKVLEFRALNRMIPRNVFVVTFDDAYANVYFSALPTLLRLNIPATIFVPTAYLNSKQPFPFDDWGTALAEQAPPETWLPMSKQHCHELLDTGLIELGAHTHSHRDFRSNPQEFHADLTLNVAQLETDFGVQKPTFAFPFGTRRLGYCSEELIAAARAIGVQCALHSDSGVVAVESDPFSWGRFTVEHFDTSATLAAKLNGWHDAVRSAARAGAQLVRAVKRTFSK